MRRRAGSGKRPASDRPTLPAVCARPHQRRAKSAPGAGSGGPVIPLVIPPRVTGLDRRRPGGRCTRRELLQRNQSPLNGRPLTNFQSEGRVTCPASLRHRGRDRAAVGRFVGGCCPFAARRAVVGRRGPGGSYPSGPVTSAFDGVEVRGFEPLTSSVRVSGSPPLCGPVFPQVASNRQGQS
jgi:hypothetical protein